MARDTHATLHHRVTLLAGVCIVIAGLYLAREVLVPIALAILFSFLLSPIVNWLEKRRFGRVPSVLLTVLLAIGVLGGVGWIVGDQLVDLAAKLPEYKTNIQDKIAAVKTSTTGALSETIDAVRDIGREITGAADPNGSTPPIAQPEGTSDKPVAVAVVDQPSNLLSFAVTTFSTLLNQLATFGIVVIFVIFMLLGRDDLKDRAIRLIGGSDINTTTSALNDAGERVSRYLLMQLVVNVTYGIPIAIGLALIGVPNAILWGLMATVLRFLPYLGPWLAAAFPILLSLAAPGWTQPLLTVALFVVIELISNNVVEPLLYGSSTGLSPVAVLAAAVFWTWLWGLLSLLLATPLTVLLVVMGKYIPQLEFFPILLGDQPVLSPPAQLYQRLLSADMEDIDDLANTLAERKPVAELYDSVLVPALVMAHHDARHGRLSHERLHNFRELMLEMAEELPDKEEHPEKPTAPAPVPVVIVPARDQSDEIGVEMLAQLLSRDGYKAAKASVDHLASELLEVVRESGARIVCISAFPPGAVTHTRYLCKRLHAAFPEITIVACLWNSRLTPDAAKYRLTCADNDVVVRCLADAREQIRKLAVAQSLKDRTPVSEPPVRREAHGRARSERLQAKPLENLDGQPAHSDVPVD